MSMISRLLVHHLCCMLLCSVLMSVLLTPSESSATVRFEIFIVFSRVSIQLVTQLSTTRTATATAAPSDSVMDPSCACEWRCIIVHPPMCCAVLVLSSHLHLLLS